MNRFRLAICLAWIALISFCFVVNRALAQEAPPAAPPQGQVEKPATSPSDPDKDAKDKDAKKAEGEEGNPFAPEPATALPAGMTGSDTNDPRFKLAPGLYDAGETAMGIEHLLLVK